MLIEATNYSAVPGPTDRIGRCAAFTSKTQDWIRYTYVRTVFFYRACNAVYRRDSISVRIDRAESCTTSRPNTSDLPETKFPQREPDEMNGGQPGTPRHGPAGAARAITRAATRPLGLELGSGS